MKKVVPPATVAEYIKNASSEARPQLKRMRALIKGAVPKAEEKISYRMPLYKHHGMLVAFAAAKKHIGLYALSGTFLKRHGKEALKYQTSKGTLQFSFTEKLPATLIKNLIKAKAKENESR